MPWTITTDLPDFAAAAGGFLRSAAVENTITLAAMEGLRASGTALFGPEPPLFGWWQPATSAPDDPAIGGAFMHTPPYPILLTGQPEEAAAELAAELVRSGRELPGVKCRLERGRGVRGRLGGSDRSRD